MTKCFWMLLVLGTITCLLLPARPAAADPQRYGVRDATAERIMEGLLARIDQQERELCELRQKVERSQYQQAPVGYQQQQVVINNEQPQYQSQMGYGGQPMMMPQGGYGGQPMVIYQQPQYQQQELGPVIIMPGQNQGGYFREVAGGYYKIDGYPTLRLPRGARILKPWKEGYSGVTLRLPD